MDVLKEEEGVFLAEMARVASGGQKRDPGPGH